MNKILLIISLIVSCPALMLSQSFPYVEYGVKMGGSLTPGYFSNDEKADPINLVGQQLGLRFVHVQTKHAGILLELNYNKLEQKLDNLTYSYDCVQFPFLTHIPMQLSNSLGVIINAGGFTNVLLNRDDKLVLERDFLYGLAAGVGINLTVKKLAIGLEGRYYFTLPTNSLTNDKLRSNILEVGLSLCYSTRN